MRLFTLLASATLHHAALQPGATYTVREVLLEAVQQQQAGDVDAAVILYEQVLQAQPLNADALHLLGVVAHSRSDHDRAADLIKMAIEQRPYMSQCYNNLGEVQRQQKKFDEAQGSYESAIRLDPTVRLQLR
jgi:Tfp pilus assembly protein PilF